MSHRSDTKCLSRLTNYSAVIFSFVDFSRLTRRVITVDTEQSSLSHTYI